MSMICRECDEGKHRACDGTAWDHAGDRPVECDCAANDHELLELEPPC